MLSVRQRGVPALTPSETRNFAPERQAAYIRKPSQLNEVLSLGAVFLSGARRRPLICLIPMATRKKTKPAKKLVGGEMLQEAAKAIGSALGAIARKTGIAHTAEAPKATGRLAKKPKKRSPPKKKRAKKAAVTAPIVFPATK
jgi:hypothetical protein